MENVFKIPTYVMVTMPVGIIQTNKIVGADQENSLAQMENVFKVPIHVMVTMTVGIVQMNKIVEVHTF